MIHRPLVVAALAALILAAVPLATSSPAHAQLIQRERDKAPAAPAPADKSAPKPAAGAAADDDDILAPVKDPKAAGDKKEPAAARAFKIGLVPLVPIGDAGKSLADGATAGVLKELNAGTLFDATGLAVDVKPAGGAGGIDEAAAKAALEKGNALLAKGRELVEKFQFGKAKQAFEQAVVQLEKAAPVLADLGPLFDARLGLAEVAAKTGADAEVEIQLAYAASLNPELDLDKKRYPPQFVSTHKKARDRLLKDKRGSVVVDASGAGAAVQIDGRDADRAPVTITEVPQGRHVVRVLREGLPAYGAVVDVKAGEAVTVSPGFIAKDGTSYVDDLQNNRLSPAAAKAVADAAKAQGMKAAVVGVAAKDEGRVPVQLVVVDAASGGMQALPALSLDEALLDVSIEVLKAREALETLYPAPAAAPKLAAAPLPTLIEGAKAGAAAQMANVALQYDVRIAKERPSSRLVTGDKPKGGDSGLDDDDGRSVLSAGKTGTRQRIDDDEDPYAAKPVAPEPDPEAPITEQAWFWPTVVGGGVGALVLLSAGTYMGLVAGDVLPDPRPASGATITVTLPQ